MMVLGLSMESEVSGVRATIRSRPAPTRMPVATYRLQFHSGFKFADASKILPYLNLLGITDVYASPYLRARSGSSHGYDVSDPNSLNPEVGTQDEYVNFAAMLAKHHMGQVLDIVPNHMGIADSSNTWWLDVLENGPGSIYSNFFDINWDPPRPGHADKNKVILPILGDQYGRVLENGELTLSHSDGAFFLHYYEFKLPLSPKSYIQLLEYASRDMRERIEIEDEHLLELKSIITALAYLPSRDEQDREKLEERNREKEVVKRRINRLAQESTTFNQSLQTTLKVFNGTKADKSTFDMLDSLLSEQAYRLAFWRVASEEINYRRFFDVSELAAVRMEDKEVFKETHKLLLEMVRERQLSGLRVDHVDGLWDPKAYLCNLQKNAFIKLHVNRTEQQPVSGDEHETEEELTALFHNAMKAQSNSSVLRPIYVVVEKILGPGETLREDWPIHGSIGYDFLNLVNGLFIERENRDVVDNIYTRFVRNRIRYADLTNHTRKMIMLISLASEVNELGYELKRIADKSRLYRDFTLNNLTFAIREIIACLAVYRTYIAPDTGAISEKDRTVIEAAVSEAKKRNPRTEVSIFDFIKDVLLLANVDSSLPDSLSAHLYFVAKFQQCTGPVMAKGVEDTAFYLYNRLLSLNEVGGDPDKFGVSVTQFHSRNAYTSRQWPYTMLTTSTHDTKRSEDVRARLNVLSEIPREWRAALTRWSRLTSRRKRLVDGRLAPDRNEEYLFYQSLLGSWPLGPMKGAEYETYKNRIADFMYKAIKEAKVNTSWTNPSEEYEAAIQEYVLGVLDDTGPNLFLEDFHYLRNKVSYFGMFNSLSQTLLKLTSPGVPDIYQGNEIWDFSLVDPDNRRPVDYKVRAKMLEDIRKTSTTGRTALYRFAERLTRSLDDGRIKLYLTYKSLNYRNDHAQLFAQGSYLPLRAGGSKKRHVCAFSRSKEAEGAIAIAPLLVAGLTGGAMIPPLGDEIWKDSFVFVYGSAGVRYRNVFTDEVLETTTIGGKGALLLKDVFQFFPVALLDRLSQ